MKHHCPSLRLSLIIDLSLEYELNHTSFFRPNIVCYPVTLEQVDDLALGPFRVHFRVCEREVFGSYHFSCFRILIVRWSPFSKSIPSSLEEMKLKCAPSVALILS